VHKTENRTPYKILLKKLEILPVPCQYKFSINFNVNNEENFE
jgi:hypothetical protein